MRQALLFDHPQQRVFTCANRKTCFGLGLIFSAGTKSKQKLCILESRNAGSIAQSVVIAGPPVMLLML